MRQHASRLFTVLTIAATAITLHTASAVDVYTEPVGFYKVDLLTNSDTHVSDPFTRSPEFHGVVSSVSGSTINVNGNPNWTPTTQWATPSTPNGYLPYYVILLSGAKEGAWYTITNNGASSLSVVLSPEDLSSVAANDRVRIVPFWTLNTIFPSGTGVVTTVSTLTRKTEIYVPNLAAVGINQPALGPYFYFNNAWRKFGAAATSNFNDVVFLPDQYVFARQNNNATTTTLTTIGHVHMQKLRIPLYANSVASGLKQDNFTIIPRPANETLNESGLSNAFEVTTSTLTRKDELYVFDGTVTAKNKTATGPYFFFNGGWRKFGAATTINYGTSNVLLAAGGYYVRRTTNNVPLRIWVNSANYTN